MKRFLIQFLLGAMTTIMLAIVLTLLYLVCKGLYYIAWWVANVL